MMKSWVRKSIKVGILSAGMLLFTGQAAHADDWNSTFNAGIGNGNQVRVDAQVPINICGNAIVLGGDAQAGCVGGSHASTAGGGDTWDSTLNLGIGVGNQVYVPMQVPIDISGNAIAGGGDAAAWSQGGTWADINGDDAAKTAKTAKVGAPAAKAAHGFKRESARTESTWDSTFNLGIGVGNQVYVPIQVPINICGNAIGAGGDASAGCKGGADATIEDGAGDWTSTLNIGIGNGNQVYVPVQVPINICGNAIGFLGDATAGCKGGATATIGDHNHGNGGGNGGGGNGGGGNGGGGNGGGYHSTPKKAVKKATKKESLPLVGGLGGVTQLLPVNGLLGGVTGEDRAATRMAKAPKAPKAARSGGSCMDWTSFLNIGIGNGNQVFVPIQVPIDISGNAVAVGGDAAAMSHGGASAKVC